MTAKKPSKRRPSKSRAPKSTQSKRLASFNKTQEIYKLLEKGIIESEALLSSAVDRPEDDAHVLDLLESARSSTPAPSPRSKKPRKRQKAQRKHRR